MTDQPLRDAESVAAIPVTFTCTAKGYESKVTVDGANPKRAGEMIAEWLEFQQRYLHCLKPGETVRASK
jgi:hypothetical protein